MKHGSNGQEVYSLQVMLEELGYDLPRFGADGWYGDETDQAVAEFALAYGVDKTDGETSDKLIRAIRAEHAKLTVQECFKGVYLPTCIVDRRNTTGKTHRRGTRRHWRDVTGITLHQTATCLLLDKHFDDETRVAKAIDRASRIPVHHTILRNGVSVWSNPYDNEMPQAQRVFNKYDVGIEIDGWYEGVVGDDSTFWRPASRPDRQPMELTTELIEAAHDTIRFICRNVKANGGQVKYIHAHRQTSKMRTSDPGEKIWKAIAVPMIKELGLSYGGPGFFVPTEDNWVERGVWTTKGPGRPIPVEWDDTAKYRYRDSPKKPEKQA